MSSLPVPGRLSTMICCPSNSDIRGAMMREEMSTPPPTAKGTIQRMGLLGQLSCARAPGAASSTATSAAASR
jgi:hypothetical protein